MSVKPLLGLNLHTNLLARRMLNHELSKSRSSCFESLPLNIIYTHTFFRFSEWHVPPLFSPHSLSYPSSTLSAVLLLCSCCLFAFADPSCLNHTCKTHLTECWRAWWFVVQLKELTGASHPKLLTSRLPLLWKRFLPRQGCDGVQMIVVVMICPVTMRNNEQNTCDPPPPDVIDEGAMEHIIL